MWKQLLTGGLISLLNFAIHDVMTAPIAVATDHTSRAPIV